MSAGNITWLLIIVTVFLANIPWFYGRFLLFARPARKKVWMCLVEWLMLYFLAGFLAFGVEKKMQGETHAQDWEFYAVTFFLFVVFAFPGFIYRGYYKGSKGRGRGPGARG